MKLKDKLITAFLIMIVMPVMLIVVTASTIVHLQMTSIQQSYNVETETIQVITNPIQILNRLTRGVYNEIKLNAAKNPEKLEDMGYYAKLEIELQGKYSFLAVRRDNEFIYIGKENEFEQIKHILPAYGAGNTNVDGGIYLGGKNPFLVKCQDFVFSDGEGGTIFVITNLNILMPELKNAAVQSIISFFVIILLTASLLIYWIYRSIIRPLNILKIATNQIKEGDLSYSVQSDTRDEIGQLCEDFEEMRVRLKALIEDQLQYEEDIKELISNISHDIKTPLTAIKGYSEGLLDGVADTPQKQEKYLKTIYLKANDMSVLVDELAYYAKIDNNNIPYDFKDINVQELFSDCIADIYLDMEVKNIKIDYENQVDQKVQVMVDAEQLKRVITNITSNSMKYMDKDQGWINISLTDVGEFIAVDIKDNGSGIPKADLPYIFDRFYRGDSSRNSKKGGSGLGLAIAKKVIEDHFGTITATSSIEEGTTIRFTLKKSSTSH